MFYFKSQVTFGESFETALASLAKAHFGSMALRGIFDRSDGKEEGCASPDDLHAGLTQACFAVTRPSTIAFAYRMSESRGGARRVCADGA